MLLEVLISFISLGGTLVSDDLYLLDLRNGEDQGQWIIVPVVGLTPGRRYGHIISFFRPYLIVFGGNIGNESINDIWSLCVEKAPFSWTRIQLISESPLQRVYHSAAQCLTGTATGMMIIYGGRTNDGHPLNDIWGLRRHRDGNWDWLRAPSKPGTLVPKARYQHTILFMGSLLLVVGGRTDKTSEIVPFETYDTETSEWASYKSPNRFRHGCWIIDEMIYIYGGFQQESPIVPTGSMIKCSVQTIISGKKLSLPPTNFKEDAKNSAKKEIKQTNEKQFKADNVNQEEEKKVFKLAGQAHVAISFNAEDLDSDFANLVRRISISRLQEEGKKIAGLPKIEIAGTQVHKNEALYSVFINNLLKPKDFSEAIPDINFPFKKETVIQLAEECQSLFLHQPLIAKVRTPVKIFGNLHGNFQDLMRFFDCWKAPVESSTGGDIDSFAYVFLGNYVDRGTRGLETICLLLALKLKYPDQIHLLRGNHEDRSINFEYGFGQECSSRFHEDPNDPGSVFQAINNAFACLPLAVVIEERILCIHSGIGPNIQKLEDLKKLSPSAELSQNCTQMDQKILLEALWSDPSPNDSIEGFSKNSKRNYGGSSQLIQYGHDKVQEFLGNNGLELIVRSHDNPMEGLQSNPQGNLLSITSCSNYCGTNGNYGCILVVQKTFEITPKLLLPPQDQIIKIWNDDKELLKNRPPTPTTKP